jgi:integrase/recombinase XerD
MKYLLDQKNSVSNSLLFWIEKFVRHKLTSLSNRNIKDKEHFNLMLQRLIVGTNNIDELITITKEVRNIGLSGIGTYFNPLKKLFYYINNLNLYSLKQIDEELLSDFLATNTINLSDASKKNHRVAMTSFFKYIDKQNYANTNDTKEQNGYQFNIELKNWGGLSGKSGSKLPSFMNEEEIKRFVQAIDSYPFSFKIAARNRAIIKLILYTGIRVSEAINLVKKDIYQDGELYILQIKGKGNKPRVSMIKSNIIQKDLVETNTICKCNNSYLFCNKFGNPLTQSYISRTVEKILISAGLRKEKNGAHMLRHSFATMLYLKHKDLILVQEALGHADINTSRIYTHFDKDKLVKTTNLF